jgi:hypothetical protein
MREHLRREFDQGIHVDFCGAPWLRSEHWIVLKRSHSSASRVTESLNRTEAAGAAALRGEPCVNERVAETVWQRVSQHPGETVERSAWQIRELVILSAERHGYWGDLNAASHELRGELEGGIVASVFHGDRSNGSPPQADLLDHDSSPHFHFFFVDVVGLRRPDARFR